MASRFARIRAVWPMPLFTWRMRTLPLVSVFGAVVFGPRDLCHTNVLGMSCLLRLCARTVAERIRLDAALTCDLFNRGQRSETFHRGENHVVRVRGSERLRENVGDAGAFQIGRAS